MNETHAMLRVYKVLWFITNPMRKGKKIFLSFLKA